MLSTFLLFLLKVTLIVPVHTDYTNPHCQNRQVIVELFEWKWSDVAAECERFLSKKSYCGVQISPVAEHALVTNDHMRPWWERYQPVSYELTSRGGNESQLREMVDRCNKVGVRIYVDVVINNMASLGRSGIGSAGNPFDADAYDFPAVPYKREHFNPRAKCASSTGNVDNYGDPNNVRNCNVDGHTDLDQNLEYVRDMITGFLNKLIDIGVSGFRIDSAEHMWPDDLSAIQKRLKDVPGGGKPFFYHEVNEIIDSGVLPKEYFSLGFVSEYRYCRSIAGATGDYTSLTNITDGLMDPQNALVFVDSHLNQRTDRPGQVITFKTPREYKMAQAFTLAYNYGFVRVMSSYNFTNISAGPPHGQDFTAKDVTLDADGTCQNGWVCEHRWKPIANMVIFRNAVAGTDVQHWYNNGSVLAFARGNKGFFAMSKSGQLHQQFQTDLPAGEYCNIIHDCQQKVQVDSRGLVNIDIDDTEEPMVAIFDDGSHTTTKGITTTSFSTSSSPSTADITTTPLIAYSTRSTYKVTISTLSSSDLPYTTSTPVTSAKLSSTLLSKSSSTTTSFSSLQTGSNTNSALSTSRSSVIPLTDSSKVSGATLSLSSVMPSMTSQGVTNLPPSTYTNIETSSSVSHTFNNHSTIPQYTSRSAFALSSSSTTTPLPTSSTTKDRTMLASKATSFMTSPVSSSQLSATDTVTPSPTNIKLVSGTSNIRTTESPQVSTVKHNTLTSILSSSLPTQLSTPVASVAINLSSTDHVQTIITNPNHKLSSSASASTASATSTITSSSIPKTQSISVTSLAKINGSSNPVVTSRGYSITSPVSKTVSVSSTTSPYGNAVTSTKGYTQQSTSSPAWYTHGFSGSSPLSFTKGTSPSASYTQGFTVSNKQGLSSLSTQSQTVTSSSSNSAGASSSVTSTQGFSMTTTLPTTQLSSTPRTNTQESTSTSSKNNTKVSISAGVSLSSLVTNKQVTLPTNSPIVLSTGTTITSSPWQRTVILIQKPTRNGEDVFIKGGIDHDHRSGCSTQVFPNPCAIPIRHRPLGTGSHYAAYNAWSLGDNYLDWYGAEPGQGSFKGRPAEGTPALWTTNNPNKPEYSTLNNYGDQYWLMDIDMDCSKAADGFFEFKGDVNGDWEGQVTGNMCSGTGSVTPPYASENHMARCGYINVFHWGSGSCEIYPFNTPTTITRMMMSITSGTITATPSLATTTMINPPSTEPPFTTSTSTSTSTSKTTTVSPWQRTVILLEFRSHSGQDVFIKGGIDHAHSTGCSSQFFSDPCAIPIKYRRLGTGPHYAAYNAWSSGDNYLDWYGAEPGQGSFKGRQAEGSPALWTTNNPNKPEYSSLNSYGDHYWLMDVNMDCSKTVGSFFEFKGDVNGGWEGQVTGSTCSGTGSVTPPYSSENHMARCGYINVFHWGTSSCEIHQF